MNIANGDKRGSLAKWFEIDPNAQVDNDARIAAITQWADARHGGWLRSSDITDFTIYDVTDDSFRIDFTHDTDALFAMPKIGGRVVEE
ncbi:hypothetical protein KX729_09210 [Rhizobium sp. XQZ8]|uniref:hypothetical protein n=1 Tax=Rhizobium populisoli TaxID=2859785 RepID=UPI001CA5A7EA|nr:hypothetical protein [Rhizobium populisoli]MBW6421617.1 hypothetical protein [Rhizobium populisoli]